MHPSTEQCPSTKLSVCITTFNRASFIGATLDSIVSQMRDDCEIVVLDGGSTDDTEQVVMTHTHNFKRFRYIRQKVNSGFDRDCDCAVQVAIGQYCWLMTDDDLLKPGAVDAVLAKLYQNQSLSLIMVNLELRDFSMSKIVHSRWLDIDADRIYKTWEMDRFFVEAGDSLNYVGGIVIKRELWLQSDRRSFYGSLFVYLGVIFQETLPGDISIIAEPYISYRSGNAHAWSEGEVIFDKWPSIVRSLGLSEAAKDRVHSSEPWKHLEELLVWRGLGVYSRESYLRWIRPQLRSRSERVAPGVVAVLPRVLANACFMLYCFVARRPCRGVPAKVWVDVLKESEFYCLNWRPFRRSRKPSVERH